jgi:hypothetical protein
VKSHRQLNGFLAIVAFCSILIACKSDPFIGSWKPAPSGDNDVMKIDSLNINKDGTFSMKYKDSNRKEITGTFTKTGDKLELKSSAFRKSVEATIDNEGRLKVSEGGRDPVSFVKG